MYSKRKDFKRGERVTVQQKKRLQEGGLYSAKREARVPGVQAAASGGGL